MNINKLMNSLSRKDNKTRIIGLLSILIFLWIMMYFIPELLISLLDTFLGNIILLLIILLVGLNDYKYGVGLFAIIVVIHRYCVLSRREKFTQQSHDDFISIQRTINPQSIFDMDKLKDQVSQDELDYFNENGEWPWSQETELFYMQAISKNPYIRTSPKDSVGYVKKIYNENAILQILSQQTKEGQFLLSGILVKDPNGNSNETLPSGFGEFGYTSGLKEDLSDDVIKCNMDTYELERTTYTGRDGINNAQTSITNKVDYTDLENIIPGFKFVNEKCNPCLALKSPPDYSCPFELKLKGKPSTISPIWKSLWGINDPYTDVLQSKPSFLDEKIDPNEFPLLSELQSELRSQKK